MDHLSVQQNFPLPVIADAGDLQDNTEGKITKTCDLETLEAGPEGQRALSWTCRCRSAEARAVRTEQGFSVCFSHRHTAVTEPSPS